MAELLLYPASAVKLRLNAQDMHACNCEGVAYHLLWSGNVLQGAAACCQTPRKVQLDDHAASNCTACMEQNPNKVLRCAQGISAD